MATTPYSPVSWGPGPIEAEKLQKMAQNDQWLFENTARMLYLSSGIKKTDGLKIASGKALYGSRPTTNWTFVDIQFGGFFSTGCSPVVVATPHSRGAHAFYATSIRGITGGDSIDHRGFRAYALCWPGTKVLAPGLINWIAVGW